MKMPKVEIEMEMDEEEGPASGMGAAAAEAEDDMMEEMAPKGKFTPKGLAPLVKAANALLPLFGQTGDYPMITETVTVIPTDLFRVLSMFAAAVDDAIAGDMVDGEMAMDFSGVRDDSSLMLLAGKLSKLAANRDFKKFLKEPMAPKEESKVDEERTPMPKMTPEDEDTMMMERL